MANILVLLLLLAAGLWSGWVLERREIKHRNGRPEEHDMVQWRENGGDDS